MPDTSKRRFTGPMQIMLLAGLVGAGFEAYSADGGSRTNRNAGDSAPQEQDPWESFNRSIFTFNDAVDRWALRPVASGYRTVTPDFVDKAVTNVFRNVGDVVSLANTILQLKPERAAATTTRIMFNTIFGLGGIFDIATQWGIPRQREDFGQTLVHWGLPEGNYLMLPLLGPATITDALGMLPDGYINPLNHLDEPQVYLLSGLEIVDQRADVIPGESLIVGDRYTFLRNAYLQQRRFVINDGKVESDPFLNDDF